MMPCFKDFLELKETLFFFFFHTNEKVLKIFLERNNLQISLEFWNIETKDEKHNKKWKRRREKPKEVKKNMTFSLHSPLVPVLLSFSKLTTEKEKYTRIKIER